MRRFPLLIFVFALASGGCDFETFVEIDVPELEPAIVMVSVPQADSVWTVTLGRTVALNDRTTPVAVENADVIVYEGGAPIDTLRYVRTGDVDPFPFPSPRDLAVYQSARGLTPLAGRTYRIDATAPDLPLASAEITVLDAPEAELVSATTSPDPRGNSTTNVSFAFTDPAGDDVYELALLRRDSFGGGVDPERTVRFTAVSPSFREDYALLDVDVALEQNADYFGPVVFRDALFAGRRQTFEIQFNDFDNGTGEPHSYSVLIVRVSGPYADYQISRELQDANEGNPFAEPSPLYSNVTGGHGFVGSIAVTRIPVPVSSTGLAATGTAGAAR